MKARQSFHYTDTSGQVAFVGAGAQLPADMVAALKGDPRVVDESGDVPAPPAPALEVEPAPAAPAPARPRPRSTGLAKPKAAAAPKKPKTVAKPERPAARSSKRS